MKLSFKLTKRALKGLPILFGASSLLARPVLNLLLSQTALANEVPGVLLYETLPSVSALNIACEPDCGRFFEEGRTQFEQEIQRLEDRLSYLYEEENLLDIDPSVQEQIESRQLELED